VIANRSNAIGEKEMSINDVVMKAQRLRLQRFSLSVATYAVAILATFLITLLGLGDLDFGQWSILIGLSLSGITFFFVLFYTNTNLRFSEPSLTREQIVYSSFYGIVAMYWLPEARPVILLFFLPPFTFGMLILTFRQYLHVVAWVLGFYGVLLALEYFQGRQGFEIQYQLFLFTLFAILLTWFAFFGGFISRIKRRLRVQKEETNRVNEGIKIEIEERKRTQIEKDTLIVELKNALQKVKTLSGLLPICASCKKIRDDNGYWSQIESYIQTHSEAEFSHSICPNCARMLYPEFDLYDENE